MSIIYSLVVYCSYFVVYLLRFFNKRLYNWLKVRKYWNSPLLSLKSTNKQFIWIHCASAGEFEQAIPLINVLKKKKPTTKIAVSFFSSSGYDLYKNSNLADLYFYFPLDTKKNARMLITLLQPSRVIFVRKEIWRNILLELNIHAIPAFLLNAGLSPSNSFFYRFYLKKTLPLFSKIFDTKTFGNTKLEQVCNHKHHIFKDDILEDFCKNSLVLIAGSSWKTEENMLAEFFNRNHQRIPNLKLIIAPHEYDENKYFELQQLFSNRQLASVNNVAQYSNYPENHCKRILFLDQKGILKYVYRYGAIAIIGGGFCKSIHNLAEAAVYGLPTVFGPVYEQFEEAIELVELGTAFPVKDYASFEDRLLKLINDYSSRTSINEKLVCYFKKQENIAAQIANSILE